MLSSLLVAVLAGLVAAAVTGGYFFAVWRLAGLDFHAND